MKHSETCHAPDISHVARQVRLRGLCKGRGQYEPHGPSKDVNERTPTLRTNFLEPENTKKPEGSQRAHTDHT